LNIKGLDYKFNVSELNAQIDSNPDIWDKYPFRTSPESPHREVSDIWVRYNDLEKLGPSFNDKHESVWYPVSNIIPAVKRLCANMLSYIQASEFGGVLITKIPPHGKVYPHNDKGWHAEHYNKYAILLKGNEEQSFCFDGEEHRCKEGDSFTFNNQAIHWVLNPTDIQRETLIICAR
jgi:hypothetical protein